MTESHLVAASLAAGGRPLVLKDGETFAVFGQAGEIRPDGLGEEGLYHDGTRFLSRFTLELAQQRLFYLDSSVEPLGQIMNVTLTNPPLVTEAGVDLGLATLQVASLDVSVGRRTVSARGGDQLQRSGRVDAVDLELRAPTTPTSSKCGSHAARLAAGISRRT